MNALEFKKAVQKLIVLSDPRQREELASISLQRNFVREVMPHQAEPTDQLGGAFDPAKSPQGRLIYRKVLSAYH